MASDADFTHVPVTDQCNLPAKQTLEDVESKLASLSDREKLCTRILDDLMDLNEILVRKSLQDTTLPPTK